jgi:hypothetical protein
LRTKEGGYLVMVGGAGPYSRRGGAAGRAEMGGAAPGDGGEDPQWASKWRWLRPAMRAARRWLGTS